MGATSTSVSLVRAYTPAGPCLTTASSAPASSTAAAAARVSLVPTATSTSTSSRLPTATVTCASAPWTCSRACSGEVQNTGR
jgi:hypothetical protein